MRVEWKYTHTQKVNFWWPPNLNWLDSKLLTQVHLNADCHAAFAFLSIQEIVSSVMHCIFIALHNDDHFQTSLWYGSGEIHYTW